MRAEELIAIEVKASLGSNCKINNVPLRVNVILDYWLKLSP